MVERVIAIDGPAGSGKSSTAREVARQMDWAHLDSGALYRALTYLALRESTPIDDATLVALAEETPVALGPRDGDFFPAVGSLDVSDWVRSDAVTQRVSRVAALPGVRDWATRCLRGAAAEHPHGVVCDGRDIGTVVFPDAGLKIFLIASVQERARRRALELHGSAEPPEIERLSQEILDRDRADSTRAVAPLVKASDAVEVDTSCLTLPEQVTRIVTIARKSFS